jgi:hypothetical protein
MITANKPPKAADIADTSILRAIYEICRERDCWALGWHIDERFPDFPPKVVQAKRRRLLQRGLVTGCPCGCRGDWELTAAGYALIDAKPWRPNPMELDR